VASFIFASSLLTKGVYSFTENEAWVPTILALLPSLAIISMYIALAKKYPGMSLIEINTAVFGNILGKLISFCYVFFFLSLVILNTHDLGHFVTAMLLPKTPLNIIYVIFILACAMAAGKGAGNIARYGGLFAIVTIIIIVGNAALLVKLIEPKNLLPVFTLPLKNYMIGIQIVTMMPYCEIVVFMMFYPYVKSAADFKKGMIRGLLLGSFILLIIVLRDISVQGSYLSMTTLPTFSTIRLIDTGDVLTRLDIIYAAILISLYFFKISALYFATVSAFSKLVRFEPYKQLILIFGVLIVIYTNAMFMSVSEHTKWKMTTAATYSTFFIVVLPLLTLIVSAVRGSQKNRALNGKIP
jgi:spore germination protein KB